MKYIGYFAVGLVALLVVGIVTLWGGARMALDETYAHTKATAQLPFFADKQADGIVRIATARGDFRARVAGFKSNADRPLVVLLHGFPTTSVMWVDLIAPLASAGYRVVAFDQRGYSPEIRPEAVNEYVVPRLVEDLFAVVESVGGVQFHLVGHDWGAGVGWGAVLANPDRILSWTPLSIAHPLAFQSSLETDPEQQSKSAYFALFVTPSVPEILFAFNSFSMLRDVLDGMSPEKMQEYIDVFSEPGALTAALNWYRASFAMQPPDGENQNGDVFVPTLFIWGNQDTAVGRKGTELMADYMQGPYSILELDAGHWLLSEKPEQVIEPVLAHIKRNDPSATQWPAEGQENS